MGRFRRIASVTTKQRAVVGARQNSTPHVAAYRRTLQFRLIPALTTSKSGNCRTVGMQGVHCGNVVTPIPPRPAPPGFSVRATCPAHSYPAPIRQLVPARFPIIGCVGIWGNATLRLRKLRCIDHTHRMRIARTQPITARGDKAVHAQ